MSALERIPDSRVTLCHVRKVPEADKCGIGLPEPIWADRVRRQAVPSLLQPADGLRADAQECVSLRDSMPRRYLGIRRLIACARRSMYAALFRPPIALHFANPRAYS